MLEPNKSTVSTTVSAKEADRAKIKAEVAEYLACGGNIEVLESVLAYGNYKPAHVTRENGGLGGLG